MRVRQWFLLIGFIVALGCLQVAQRTAVVMKGYAVGERMHQLHARQTDVSWLNVQIAGLSSPARLAQVVKDRQLKLVAWSTLSPAHPAAASTRPGTMTAGSARSGPAADRTLGRTLAALDHDEAAGGDTAD
ncbi:MAG: hypothetical protein HY599_03310 [Candidatus Omnitrophica bacterium]|nr:hypothetical protein [Candidatus Omnitrophota bacterium]